MESIIKLDLNRISKQPFHFVLNHLIKVQKNNSKKIEKFFNLKKN
jgi:hypothetical protein